MCTSFRFDDNRFSVQRDAGTAWLMHQHRDDERRRRFCRIPLDRVDDVVAALGSADPSARDGAPKPRNPWSEDEGSTEREAPMNADGHG